MCGISGAFGPYRTHSPHLALLKDQIAVMRHRGPDDAGFFADNNCALGHCRLSIIDLSRDGRQPFASHDGRYQMVFNGEIFNYIELRDTLHARGHIFRTKTDTEVLLAAYQEFGANCLNHLNGMFAFAVYDTLEQTLFLARDRFGIKPLYYARHDGMLYFASEIKALLLIPDMSPTVNRQSLFDYFAFNRTDIHDETFLTEIKRLPKGCRAFCDAAGMTIQTWWSPIPFLEAAREASPEQCRRDVEELFVDALRLRLRSDVPIGSCLSGGLDSSILVGVLYDRLKPPSPYHCFTAAYPGDPVDETRYVDVLAKRYPFCGHRSYPTAEEAFADLNHFVWSNDEPTTNPSFYAQFRVMRLARETGVVVVLDGQGADESFAGYQYFHGFYLYGLLRQGHLGRCAVELWNVLRRRQHLSGLQTLAYQILPQAARAAISHHAHPYLRRSFFTSHLEKSRIHQEFFQAQGLNHSLALHFQYKLEHLLRTEDRNSMAFSLESRVPYLDYRLVERLLATPEDLKIRYGETKYLQKQALGRYTVPEILKRKDKLGFATPEAKWMRHPVWVQQTTDAMESLRRAFPDIFAFPPNYNPSPQEAWKLCQLATWLEIFL